MSEQLAVRTPSDTDLRKDSDEECVEDEQVALLFDEGQDGVNIDEWKMGMETDKELQKILTYVRFGWPNKKILCETERSFWEVRNELSEEQKILLRCGRGKVCSDGLD
ncbi:hypothetical protein NDU88_003557 [Pleurodeles waltl]|uniref:Uncharacterized protein n=1 Tax=Pleurodeles waltl TaxID=8319 RepID=A0AAV7UYR7_PLEWA|nr:hypothetical protein NDU88_003557 [Pleurodeles waltl]